MRDIVMMIIMMFGMRFTLFAEQRVAILLGDLIIIGMDFRKSEEAVTVAAIFDERRLQRRFNPGDFGEVNIAFQLLPVGSFEIKFLDTVSVDDCDPGLLGMARVDQHAH